MRPGFITQKMLRDAVGEVKLDPALMTGVSADVKPKAPGMKYRHYAPKAELIIVEGRQDCVSDKLHTLAREHMEEGKKVGIMVSKEIASGFDGAEVISLGSRDDEEEIAKHLFDALRQFDDMQVDIIFAESFSEEGIGQAVMNRLLKAAGHRIINV